jgi:hypothetical protein
MESSLSSNDSFAHHRLSGGQHRHPVSSFDYPPPKPTSATGSEPVQSIPPPPLHLPTHSESLSWQDSPMSTNRLMDRYEAPDLKGEDPSRTGTMLPGLPSQGPVTFSFGQVLPDNQSYKAEFSPDTKNAKQYSNMP